MHFLKALLIAALIWPALASARRDYYEVLGLARTATEAEIKAAHRKLAKRHHPDRGGNLKTFQEIQEAYEVLKDDQKRAAYDRFGFAAFYPYEYAQPQPQPQANPYPGAYQTGPDPRAQNANFEYLKTQYLTQYAVELLNARLRRPDLAGNSVALFFAAVRSSITWREPKTLQNIVFADEAQKWAFGELFETSFRDFGLRKVLLYAGDPLAVAQALALNHHNDQFNLMLAKQLIEAMQVFELSANPETDLTQIVQFAEEMSRRGYVSAAVRPWIHEPLVSLVWQRVKNWPAYANPEAESMKRARAFLQRDSRLAMTGPFRGLVEACTRALNSASTR